MPKFSMTKQQFINRWLKHFAPDIGKDKFEKYVKNQHIWHVFSWELVSYDNLLVGDEARSAYDNANKENCIFCDMFGSGNVSDKIPEEYETAKKIDTCVCELYVVSKDYSWTYIKTHENDLCGPYFLKIK